MNNIAKFDEINNLLLIYGELLTEKQRIISDSYFKYNLSLQEIAADQKISKQAVSDTIETVIKKLEKYEKTLKFSLKIDNIVKKIKDLDLSDEEKAKIEEVIYNGI